MTSMQKIGVVAVLGAVVAAAIVPPLLRAAAPDKPVAAAGQGRNAQDIMKDVQDLDGKVSALMPSPALLAEAEYRTGDGQKVLPMLDKVVSLMAELEKALKADPKLKDVTDLFDEVHMGRFHVMSYAATLGDKDVTESLETLAKGKDADAIAAKSALLLSQWMLSGKDADKQQKLLDSFAVVAKENPTSDEVAATLQAMSSVGVANNDMTKKVIEVVRANMKGEAAAELLKQLDGQQDQLALVGKPFVIAGRTSTDGKFSTEQYKGKVVMLDFWATWCGPCIGELPNVKKAYASYHDKGFEIVGLSCDTEDDVLNKFTKENDMPWMQLREKSQDEKDRWHPLAKQYHVDGIPQMFLIDKNGILRFVDAREDLEKKVKMLLEEK